jgi:hypothetical protein
LRKIKKEDPLLCCSQETHLIGRNKHWLRVKGWKIIYQFSGPKKAGVATLTSDKVNFKLKLFKRDTEDYFILIIGAIH